MQGDIFGGMVLWGKFWCRKLDDKVSNKKYRKSCTVKPVLRGHSLGQRKSGPLRQVTS
jgi:hypothetical protein